MRSRSKHFFWNFFDHIVHYVHRAPGDGHHLHVVFLVLRLRKSTSLNQLNCLSLHFLLRLCYPGANQVNVFGECRNISFVKVSTINYCIQMFKYFLIRYHPGPRIHDFRLISSQRFVLNIPKAFLEIRSSHS